MTSLFLVVGIFVLAFAILFAVTKDRWEWKKLYKRALIWGAGVIAVIWCGIYIYTKIENMPKRQTEYQDIKLTDSMDDVIFKKGESTLKDISADKTSSTLFYVTKNSDSGQKIDSYYMIEIKNNKIHMIDCKAPSYDSWYCGSLNNLKIGDSSTDMIEKLGSNYELSVSSDKLSRYYSYKKYNTYYFLEKDRIAAMGIYNPEVAKVEFPAKLIVLEPVNDQFSDSTDEK